MEGGEMRLNDWYVLTSGDNNSILCSEYAIKRIDEPFVKENEDKEEWAL